MLSPYTIFSNSCEVSAHNGSVFIFLPGQPSVEESQLVVLVVLLIGKEPL